MHPTIEEITISFDPEEGEFFVKTLKRERFLLELFCAVRGGYRICDIGIHIQNSGEGELLYIFNENSVAHTREDFRPDSEYSWKWS